VENLSPTLRKLPRLKKKNAIPHWDEPLKAFGKKKIKKDKGRD